MTSPSVNKRKVQQFGTAALLIVLALIGGRFAYGDESIAKAPSHLKYFGFALVDVGWDDPHDDSAKTDYVDEVAGFCNLADLLVVDPSTKVNLKLDRMSQHRMYAVLHLHELFFKSDGKVAPSGTNHALREDYRQRWDQFVKVNDLAAHADKVAAFYVGEEPTWNGISASDLRLACKYLKMTFPDTNVMIIEAYPAIADLQIPVEADWVGFDHYFLKSGPHDAQFQREFQLLKSKRTSDHQRILLIPDAHFIPKVHKHFKVKQSDLNKIARGYYQLACADEAIIGMLAYFWPSGFDDVTALGTREMKDVRQTWKAIGQRVTGQK